MQSVRYDDIEQVAGMEDGDIDESDDEEAGATGAVVADEGTVPGVGSMRTF